MPAPRLSYTRPGRPLAWRVDVRIEGKRHQRQFRSYEDALAFSLNPTPPPPPYASPRERIERNVAVDSRTGCWNWSGRLHNTGYARFVVRGKQHLAHRFSYEAFVGPIPEALQIDHLCRNRGCVNPDHLEPVTSRENSARSPINFVGVNASKTRCKNDHPFDDGNTRARPTGGRECKTCRREISRRWRARQSSRTAEIEVAA